MYYVDGSFIRMWLSIQKYPINHKVYWPMQFRSIIWTTCVQLLICLFSSFRCSQIYGSQVTFIIFVVCVYYWRLWGAHREISSCRLVHARARCGYKDRTKSTLAPRLSLFSPLRLARPSETKVDPAPPSQIKWDQCDQMNPCPLPILLSNCSWPCLYVHDDLLSSVTWMVYNTVYTCSCSLHLYGPVYVICNM